MSELNRKSSYIERSYLKITVKELTRERQWNGQAAWPVASTDMADSRSTSLGRRLRHLRGSRWNTRAEVVCRRRLGCWLSGWCESWDLLCLFSVKCDFCVGLNDRVVAVWISRLNWVEFVVLVWEHRRVFECKAGNPNVWQTNVV